MASKTAAGKQSSRRQKRGDTERKETKEDMVGQASFLDQNDSTYLSCKNPVEDDQDAVGCDICQS